MKKKKLKIKFIILRKERYLIIDLNENFTNNNLINNIIKNYENMLMGKDAVISELKEKIQKLEKELESMEEQKKIDEKKNFNINTKNAIQILNFHTQSVNCFAVLNDGRLVSGSNDNNIIIYNKKTFQPDLIIKEHNNYINHIIKLDSGLLASCSADFTIKLYNIKEKNYEIIQTLNDHKNNVIKILELKNNNLVSCSEDKSIIFYYKNTSGYEKDYKIKTNQICPSLVQIKENEICYSEYNKFNYNIYFYDLNERKIKSTISNISSSGSFGPFNMITKDLLIIGGYNNISIINVNQCKLIREIKISNSKWIYGFCMLNENMFLTGDNFGTIRQWKIEGDDLYLISKKEEAHENNINALIKIGDEYIVSGGSDKSIKIW